MHEFCLFYIFTLVNIIIAGTNTVHVIECINLTLPTWSEEEHTQFKRPQNKRKETGYNLNE